MSNRTLTGDDLRWLACPVCHRSLELRADGILCTGCSRSYPIVDGLPVLLAERAIQKNPPA
jgi:uncharacterized protein YbaR (Trm112 family)